MVRPERVRDVENVLVFLIGHRRLRLELEGVDVHAGVVVHLAEFFVLIHRHAEAPLLQRFRAIARRGLLLRRHRLTASAAALAAAPRGPARAPAAPGPAGAPPAPPRPGPGPPDAGEPA